MRRLLPTFRTALEHFRRLRAEIGAGTGEVQTALADDAGMRLSIAPAHSADRLLDLACALPRIAEERRAAMVEDIRTRLGRLDLGCAPGDLRAALSAMSAVPRDRFVPPEFVDLAYLPMSGDIGHGQTISNPHVVAALVAAARIRPGAIVLDVGTGSGYQAAVLAHLAGVVVSMEIVPALARSAGVRLAELGYRNVQVVRGDGGLGLPDHAPFDAILVAAGASEAPPPLVEQLALGGHLVMPIGPSKAEEQLTVIRRERGGLMARSLGPVRFVPLTGRFGTRTVGG